MGNSFLGAEKQLASLQKKKVKRSKASEAGRAKKNKNRQHHRDKQKYEAKKEKKYGPKASQIYKIMGWFDVSSDSKVATGGFKGSRTSSQCSTLEELKGWVKDGTILKKIKNFRRVPYEKVCTRICDSEGN